MGTSSPPAATDAEGNTATGVAAPSGLTPNLGVGTEPTGSARIDGGAHLCADNQVFCPAGSSASSEASVCQDTNCDSCTGFTTEPNAGDISGAADVCCPDDGSRSTRSISARRRRCSVPQARRQLPMRRLAKTQTATTARALPQSPTAATFHYLETCASKA